MVVAPKEAHRFMTECLQAAGSSLKPANEMADLIVQADIYGHFSHGMNRLEWYVNDVLTRVCNPEASPQILKESPATAWVDGNNAFGATVGHFCMDLAIAKAKTIGVGWVSVKGSNHFGIAGYWSMKAEREGLLGMAFTNTTAVMAPTRSKKSALGSNPISLAAPVNEGDGFLLDMATTSVAVGKIEMARIKGEKIPDGWAQGPDGKSTNDPTIAFNTRCLMPLGGVEETSGYKGYGLSALVEIFCGILSGSHYGKNVQFWTTKDSTLPANLGHCFIAVNPEFFAPGFKDRMGDIINDWRNLPPTNPELTVLAPGDKERINQRNVESAGGIQYHENQIIACNELAKKLGVSPIKVTCA